MSSGTADHRITVYADYVCPFCYLGRESLSRYLESADDPPAVDWHPFDLRARKRNADGTIDQSADDGKDEAYYEQARENVRRLADRYGVDLAREIATDVDSLPAQVASAHVKEAAPDRWPAYHAAIFDAVWRDGKDVGDPAVLESLATECDLDPALIRAALGDDDRRAAVRAQFRDANEAGITAVPTFVYGDHAARGAVPPEQLERLVEG